MKYPCLHSDGSQMTGLDAVRESWRLMTKASKEVSDRLPAPNCLQPEKVIYPCILIGKVPPCIQSLHTLVGSQKLTELVCSPYQKKYCGIFYDDPDNLQASKIKYMGLILKRRDNPPIAKHFYAGVIDVFLRHCDSPDFLRYMEEHPGADRKQLLVQRAVAFVKGECKKLLRGDFPMEEFVLSKTLKASYKNPDSVAHKQLADRANARGTDSFQSNDRVPFVKVFVKETKGTKMLQGERIETPDFARQAKLKVDFKDYLEHSVQNPVAQVFALATEYLDGYNPTKHPMIWEKVFKDAKEKGLSDEEARKKKEEKRATIAAGLLFDSLIKEYENRLSGQRTLADLWGKKTAFS